MLVPTPFTPGLIPKTSAIVIMHDDGGSGLGAGDPCWVTYLDPSTLHAFRVEDELVYLTQRQMS